MAFERPSSSPTRDSNYNNEVDPLVDDELTAVETGSLLTTTAAGQQSSLDHEQSRSSLDLFILTIGIGGLQVVWSVQHASASPYLLSLGMSKALLACAWVAGPLTGTVVQPYIGICSDNCSSRWGKRKPFMAIGATLTAICLITMAWIREVIGTFDGLFNLDPAESDRVKTTTILFAIVLIYCLDFAINTVQAGIRAFIVDNAPWHQQKTANAWASRANGAGNILGYSLGNMDLPKILPIFGDTQFKVLCVIASFSLVFTILISCTFIKEKDSRERQQTPGNTATIPSVRLIFQSVGQLSPQIRKVFMIQVASWFGWFPFLFYATTYIGQLYVNPIFGKHRDLSDDEIDKTWADATRIGTFALFMNAIISFAANITLPLLVRPSDKEVQAQPTSDTNPDRGWSRRLLISYMRIRDSSKHLLQRLWIPGLTLRRLWMLSQFTFAICMFSTFLISTIRGASVMTGIIGISWAVTTWVPFAFIATEIAQYDADHQQSWQQHGQPGGHGGDNGVSAAVGQTGVVLGLHNVCISVPQIISSVVSGIIFKALQKPRGEPWDTSVTWVLRLGGCAALAAGFLTTTLYEHVRR